jgi:molybdenum cofactor cytidylyltransferase
MIVAVVLSAGESSRMGRPKALLPIEGQTFIERIVGALKQSGIERIVVVLGFNAEEMRRRVEHLPVDIIVNADYKLGQLSSLHAAICHLQKAEDCDGMLVHLVDHPYIDPQLVRVMLQRFAESKAMIIVPRHQGKRGHPVLFSRALLESYWRRH